MILKDYIAKLQELPQDLEVFASRGEWGPVPVSDPLHLGNGETPSVASVYAFTPDGKPQTDEGPAWYEDFNPNPVIDVESDYTRKKVVLL
jgi:hypothetical protein